MKIYNKFLSQKLINWGVFLLLWAFLSNCNHAHKEIIEDNQGFRKANLSSQAPEVLEAFIEEISSPLGLSDIHYSSFETGIDTIRIYFGSMNQSEKAGYWITLQINDMIVNWVTINLIEIDTLEFPANNIDINFDNGAKRISLRVMHEPDTDEVYYTWLNHGEKNRNALIVEIETPIKINYPFPELDLELMNGDIINTREFSGKFIVINWWHTGCGPCIAAIPGLNMLADTYKDNSEVVFLAIAFDKRERVDNLLNRRDFFFLHSIGEKETSEIFGEIFPQYVIINPEGIVTYYSTGGSENCYEAIKAALETQMI